MVLCSNHFLITLFKRKKKKRRNGYHNSGRGIISGKAYKQGFVLVKLAFLLNSGLLYIMQPENP